MAVAVSDAIACAGWLVQHHYGIFARRTLDILASRFNNFWCYWWYFCFLDLITQFSSPYISEATFVFVPMSVSWPFGPCGGRGLGLVCCCGDWELFTIVSIWFKRVRQAIGSIAYIFMANLLLLTYKLYAATTATTTTTIWIPSSSSSSAPSTTFLAFDWRSVCLYADSVVCLLTTTTVPLVGNVVPNVNFMRLGFYFLQCLHERLDLDLWFVLPCCMSAISGLLLVFLEVNNIQLILWLVLFVKT